MGTSNPCYCRGRGYKNLHYLLLKSPTHGRHQNQNSWFPRKGSLKMRSPSALLCRSLLREARRATG